MQVTLTETRVLPSPTLRLQTSTLERISTLVEKLKAFDWLSDFKKEFPDYKNGRSEEVSLALCLLLTEIIEPAIDLTSEGSEEENYYSECEEELRKILEETVPKGEKVDHFIGEFNLFNDEKKEIFGQLAIADRVMQAALDRFYGAADKAHQDLYNRINALRNRIKEHNKIHDPRQVLAANQEMLALMDKLETANTEMKNLDHIKQSILETCKRAQEQVKRI